MIQKKILVIPSWYPTENDKINGSFFREQSKLMTDNFDVRVLHLKFEERPALRGGGKALFLAFIYFSKLPFSKMRQINLPSDEVFLHPPLTLYSLAVFGVTKRRRFTGRMNAYLNAVNRLIEEGWVPDLVHAHSVNLAGLAAQKIKEKYNIPYVITEHIPFSLDGYPEYLRHVVRKAFENADIVLSLGYDKVRQLGMSGIDVDPNIVYNFVDEELFNVLCDKYKPGNELSIISVGAASFYKDHRTLLRAILHLRNKNIPFKLTLIGLKVWGDDNLYNSIIEFIYDNNLQNQVEIIDKVDRDAVAIYLSKNNIFILTSIAEGFPVSVLEAMASGLFIVGTRHGGTEDIINSEVGVLVPIKDYIKISDILEDIYNGKIIFEPQKIRDYIVSICGKKPFLERITSYYNKAISG